MSCAACDIHVNYKLIMVRDSLKFGYVKQILYYLVALFCNKNNFMIKMKKSHKFNSIFGNCVKFFL